MLALGGCGAAPEVSIRNGFESAQVSAVRFNGCVWATPLAPGEIAAPRPCWDGAAHVYYKLFESDRPQLGWQGRRSAATFDVTGADAITLTLDEAGDTPDLDAPGPFGH